MDEFSAISTPEDMQGFLSNTLVRSNPQDSLYHYTTITKLLNIIKSGYLWLGDYRYMNDPFEVVMLNENKNASHLYYTSFSRADESLAMYRMYCDNKPDASVVLKISIETLIKIMSSSYHGERAGGVDDIGKYFQFYRKHNVVEGNKISEELVGVRLFAAEIAYYYPETYSIFYHGKENKLIDQPLCKSELAGWLKYKCWDYEQEVRLLGYSEKAMEPKKRLAIKLPSDFYKNIDIILGPGFDME